MATAILPVSHAGDSFPDAVSRAVLARLATWPAASASDIRVTLFLVTTLTTRPRGVTLFELTQTLDIATHTALHGVRFAVAHGFVHETARDGRGTRWLALPSAGDV